MPFPVPGRRQSYTSQNRSFFDRVAQGSGYDNSDYFKAEDDARDARRRAAGAAGLSSFMYDIGGGQWSNASFKTSRGVMGGRPGGSYSPYNSDGTVSVAGLNKLSTGFVYADAIVRRSSATMGVAFGYASDKIRQSTDRIASAASNISRRDVAVAAGLGYTGYRTAYNLMSVASPVTAERLQNTKQDLKAVLGAPLIPVFDEINKKLRGAADRLAASSPGEREAASIGAVAAPVALGLGAYALSRGGYGAAGRGVGAIAGGLGMMMGGGGITDAALGAVGAAQLMKGAKGAAQIAAAGTTAAGATAAAVSTTAAPVVAAAAGASMASRAFGVLSKAILPVGLAIAADEIILGGAIRRFAGNAITAGTNLLGITTPDAYEGASAGAAGRKATYMTGEEYDKELSIEALKNPAQFKKTANDDKLVSSGPGILGRTSIAAGGLMDWVGRQFGLEADPDVHGLQKDNLTAASAFGPGKNDQMINTPVGGRK